MAAPSKFVEKIETLRKAKALTMSKAEQRCGFQEGRWERIVQRGHEPLAGDFLRILKGLDASADAFEPEDFDEVSS